MYHVDEMNKQIQENLKFCKLFIPLCDINKENGVTHVVKDSRNRLPVDINLLEKNSGMRFTDEFIESKYNKNDIVPLNAKIGEIYIARTDGVHKGGFVKNGKRTIIIVDYVKK